MFEIIRHSFWPQRIQRTPFSTRLAHSHKLSLSQLVGGWPLIPPESPNLPGPNILRSRVMEYNPYITNWITTVSMRFIIEIHHIAKIVVCAKSAHNGPTVAEINMGRVAYHVSKWSAACLGFDRFVIILLGCQDRSYGAWFKENYFRGCISWVEILIWFQ